MQLVNKESFHELEMSGLKGFEKGVYSYILFILILILEIKYLRN